jgi:type IV pilus biogenesis/stability protein PilW
MPKPTIRPVALIPGLSLVFIAALGVASLTGHSASAAASDWPGEDALVIDMAKAPTLSAVQREALLKLVKAIATAPAPEQAVTLDYPAAASIFPPDMVAPTFLFHDGAATAKTWLVSVAVAGEPGRLYVLTDGRRPKPEYDPRCGGPEEIYKESEYRKSAKGWAPDGTVWERLSRLPEKTVEVEVRGLGAAPGEIPRAGAKALSVGRVALAISEDPVGAPIFYRDVPLLPTKNEKGVIMPLAEGSLPLIEWRLRDLRKPAGVVVLKNMPTCANCHSFSNDGKYLGMDMDGPTGDKGAYAMARIGPAMVIRNENVFSWNTFDAKWVTFGLFSRLSPDGRYVVSAVNESVFVQNYLDVQFLQTFYPTRGILAYYDRTSGKIQALPGATDPDYIHGNGVWSPDGASIIFIRAKARESVPAGARPEKANDPREVQIKYDLYQIPFNGGRGGTARPIPGASANGMSNSFPKVSPDGRWLVWVQAKNGLLMRPDSQLYIMPLAGGAPRRMNCNLSPMNSWHSFSPNGRWMVFSSKANTPYTQMFLTHLDENGNDSPAVLVPNSTAANRAVNIPEFLNAPPDFKMTIDAPAVDYRRHLDRAADLLRSGGDLEEAYRELQAADAMKPNFAETLAAMGYYYREKGDNDRAIALFEKALEIDPENWGAHNFYGVTLFRMGRYDEAMKQFQAAIRVSPLNAQSLTNAGALEFSRGNTDAAQKYFEEAIDSTPRYARAHFNLALILTGDGRYADAAARYEECLKYAPDDPDTVGNLAWLYATCPDGAVRKGPRAVVLARKFEKLAGSAGGPRVFDILAAALAENGEFERAVEAAETAVKRSRSDDPGLPSRRDLVEIYKSGQVYPGVIR